MQRGTKGKKEKEDKYLEKENTFLLRRKRMEKEEEEHIWRRKNIFFTEEKEKWENIRRRIFSHLERRRKAKMEQAENI